MKFYAVEMSGDYGYRPIGISDSRPVAEMQCKEINETIKPFYPAIVTEYKIGKTHWIEFDG